MRMTLSPRFAYSPTPAVRLTSEQLLVRDRVIERIQRGIYPTETVPCACGAPEHADFVVAERDRYGLPVRTVLCSRCGLLRSTPRLTAAATAQFYDEDYRDLYTGEEIGPKGLFEDQRHRGLARAKVLERVIATAESVYEVGCGAGGLLDPFRALGKRVAGADLGSSYLEFGREQGLDLVQGDAADLLAHTGEPADIVFLIHVLEHFLDLPSELDKLWHLVKPGGVLVVEVPGVASIPTTYRGDLMLYLQNAHTYHFCGQTLSAVLNASGFDVAYADESAMALAIRPEHDEQPERRPITATPQTAQRLLQTLVDLETERVRQRAAANRAA